MPFKTRDIIIVGAGPTGLLLACRLIKAGLTVTVLEKDKVLPIAVRALGYYGATQHSLRSAGIFEAAAERGFFQHAFSWRKITRQVAPDRREWGDLIASWNPWETSDLELGECGKGMLTLGQDQLRKICLEKLATSDRAEVLLGHPITELSQTEDEATVTSVNASGERVILSAKYVVGADGGKSTTRKLIGQSLEGYTWPRKLVGVDLFTHITPPTDGPALMYILDKQNVGFFCPLQEPHESDPSLWRFTLQMLPEKCEPDVFDSNLREMIEIFVPGPRPLKYEIRNAQQYSTHQRQVQNYMVGRTILIGDAAHLNSPTGGLGLTTGLLDADSLGDALEMVFCENHPASVLHDWAKKRHSVWKNIVSPMSIENQSRFLNTDPDKPKDDPFLKMVIEKSPELAAINDSFNNEMVTRMREQVA